MNTIHQRLPLEIVDIIVDFASYFISDLENKQGRLDSKWALLQCSLVCKTWLWPARRLLQSLHLNLERVSIFSTRILQFSDIFGSPLCTLDSGLIQTLVVLPGDSPQDEHLVPFFTLLFALDKISLPSLHIIWFYDTNLAFSNDGNNVLSSGLTAIRSSIKAPEFRNPRSEEFESVIHAASLFPFLKTLISPRTTRDRRRGKKPLAFRPPLSLQKLNVDTLTFLYAVEWLVTFDFDLSNIVSVSINEDFNQCRDQFIENHLPQAFSLLGPTLQECELCRSPTSFFFF